MKKEEKDLLLQAIEGIKVKNYDNAKNSLHKLLYMAERDISSKINIFDFCSKDKKYESTQYVCYDIFNEVAVATDGHSLVISRSDYIDYEDSGFSQSVFGKKNAPCYLINKKGENLEARFPDYLSVIPKFSGREERKINGAKLRELIKCQRAAEKMDDLGMQHTITIGIQNFSLDIAEKISKFDKGTFYLDLADYTKPLLYDDDENYTAIFMPNLYPANEDQIARAAIYEF